VATRSDSAALVANDAVRANQRGATTTVLARTLELTTSGHAHVFEPCPGALALEAPCVLPGPSPEEIGAPATGVVKVWLYAVTKEVAGADVSRIVSRYHPVG